MYTYKMAKTILISGDIEKEKSKFHYFEYPIDINNVDIDKILISNKVLVIITKFVTPHW